MKKSIFILLWAAFLGIPVQAQTSIDDLPPEEFYDFWVGEWDASWDEPEGKKGKGVNVITKDLDQKVIRESFQILEGQSAGFISISV